MTTVLLYGHLGKNFGVRHSFAVQSAAEAVKALKANFPGFEKYMLKHSTPGYRVFTGDESVPLQELTRKTNKVIKIVPVIAGAAEGKGKAVLNIVIGAVLIYFGDYVGGAEFVGAAFIGSVASGIGISLVLGGVSTLLYKPPKLDTTEKEADRASSYAFDGAVNTTAQGNPVPICYGRLRVGSQVISSGLFTEQLL